VTEQGQPGGKAQGGGELIEKLRVEGIEHLEPFSTLGDQTILFRPSPVGGWPHGTELSQVILAGNLARIEVADLINFLTMSRLTGILLLIDVD
jgi:hypothetical protein